MPAEAVVERNKLIHGGGPMADMVRDFDWSKTPLGPIHTWSETLLSTANLILTNQFGCNSFLGPEMVQIYNDAYAPFMGAKHPAGLGQRAQDCWAEAWEFISPQLEAVVQHGTPTYLENQLIPLERAGSIQDYYFTYCYSPIYLPDGTIIGTFVTCQETTQKVLATRKLRESEDRANRILRSIGDAVIVTDADSHITGMNPLAETLTGWSEAEGKGHALEEVFKIAGQQSRPPVENPASEIKRLGIATGATEPSILVARDGRKTHIDDSSAPILNDEGQVTGIVLVFRDITARRATEFERDRIQRELAQVTEATSDGILSFDRDWRITYLNAVGKRILAPSGNILGTNFWQSYPSVIYENSPYVFHYNNAMYRGIAGDFEAFYPEPLNIFFSVSVRPSEDGIVLFFRDVTAQRSEAQALVESEARLSAIYGTAVGFIGLLSPDGTIIDCNRAALKLGGTTREKLSGLRYWQGPWFSNTKGMPDMVQRAVGRAASGEFVRQELSLVRPSGKIQTFDFSISPVCNDQGEVIFLVPEGHDISALKSTRAELAASREELHWTVELSTPIPWTSDIEGNILDFSRSFLELTGLRRDQVVGKGWMQALYSEDVDRVVSVWSDSLRSGQPVDVQYRLRTASNEFRWVRARANPRRDVDGVIVKWYGTIEDVDERKNAEDALVRSEVLAATERMTHQIADQINTPLAEINAMLGRAEISTDLEEIQRYISNSKRDIRRLLNTSSHDLQSPTECTASLQQVSNT